MHLRSFSSSQRARRRSTRQKKRYVIALSVGAAVSTFAAALNNRASAATQWYDLNNTSGLQAGNGNWSTGAGNWQTTSSPGTTTPTAWVNGNDAIFSAAGAMTATVDNTAISVNSITFGSG